jgi:hypothetical protein
LFARISPRSLFFDRRRKAAIIIKRSVSSKSASHLTDAAAGPNAYKAGALRAHAKICDRPAVFGCMKLK